MRNLGLGDLAFLGAVGGVAYDADAASYLAAVEAADGQALDAAWKDAINAFVVGCKADGTWAAIKASCIPGGARSLAGALVPLVGPAPTRFGTAAGWNYNRKTGLQGNGSDNYINTQFSASSLGANSHHVFVNGSSFETSLSAYRCAVGAFQSSSSRINLDVTGSGSYPSRNYRGPDGEVSASISTGLTTSGSISGSRTSSSLITLYQNGAAVASSSTSVSAAGPNANFFIYALNLNGTPVDYTGSRFNFYSIGDGLSAASHSSLHSRVTTLINALAALP